jgi:nicotinamidase-related amidase
MGEIDRRHLISTLPLAAAMVGAPSWATPTDKNAIAGATAADRTRKPEDIMTAKTYSAAHTALLIVDPYNDFMSEGGKLYNAIKETADASGMFANLRKLIPAVRATGIQVFIVPHHRSDAHGHDYDGWQHVNMFQEQNKPIKAFEVGSWGGEFNPEFGPQKGDVIIKEHWAQSGFANTDLDMQLKQHGIQKIIFVGLIANSCIESTARFGMELGYHVTLVMDGTAAFSPEGMKAAATNAPMFAHAIVKTNELLQQLAA